MKEPILLVHGLFGSLSDPEILDSFQGATVHAPSLIGYGETKGDVPAAWTLEDQADRLAVFIRNLGKGPVHVVGHSVGGAIAVLLTHRLPDVVLSVTSIEGNFTLGDAFWSQKIATKELPEIESEVVGFRADVKGWLSKAGVRPTPWTLSLASRWLEYQPASTLRNQARAVCAVTGDPKYLEAVSGILDRGVPFHLIAGARSRPEWNVPRWVVDRAASNYDIPNAGHLMMLESPRAFAKAILANIR